MSLIHHKSQIYKRCSLDSQLEKTQLMTKSNIKTDNRSILFDITYKLFSQSNKNNQKNKIKKIETPLINKYKYKNKTIGITINTDINKKKLLKLREKQLKINSEFLKKKKINKVNSLIIKVNNSQENKANIKTNNSFRKIINYNLKETNNNNSNNNNKKDNYFYDFTFKKKKINYFNSFNDNTYKNNKKTNNIHKIKSKLDNNDIKEKLIFNNSLKNPIKIKTNIMTDKIKKKVFIKKNNSTKLYSSKTINKELNYNYNNRILNNLNTVKKNEITNNNNLYNNNNIINSNKKKNKTAEKNYIEKWQFINGVNIDKKTSLSHNHSKKSTFFKKTLGKNNSFSYRRQKQKDLINLDFFKEKYNMNNIKEINKKIHTEINEDIHGHGLYDDFESQILNNNKYTFKIEKGNLDSWISSENNNNNNKLNFDNKCDTIDYEEEYNNNNNNNDSDNVINYKKNIIENLNKIIERKKREIDLLNMVKFTTKICKNNKEIDIKNDKILNGNDNDNKNDYDLININSMSNKILHNNNCNFNKKNIFDCNLYCNYKEDDFINDNNINKNLINYTILNDNDNYNYNNINNDLTSIININCINKK